MYLSHFSRGQGSGETAYLRSLARAFAAGIRRDADKNCIILCSNFLFAHAFVCFDSLRPIFQSCRDGSSWAEPVLSRAMIKCLTQAPNAAPPVRLETASQALSCCAPYLRMHALLQHVLKQYNNYFVLIFF